MSTKKQERATQQRRQAQLEAKIAAKRARRKKTQQAVAAVLAGGLVLGGGIFAFAALGPKEAAPAASPRPVPDASLSQSREWTGTIDTNSGPLTISLDGAAAPQAVASFVMLAKEGYFNGTQCHRLTTSEIYVLQCGDPTGEGAGSPGYSFGPIENAPSDSIYPAGTIAMARVQNDSESMGSQFFIVYADSTIPSDAAGGYTVFGTVTDGLAIVEAIAEAGTEDGSSNGRPAKTVTLNEVSVR